MPTKPTIELRPKPAPGGSPRFLVVLGAVLVLAFIALLLVGFENVLALFRYRVTLFLVLAPIILVFFWCVWKALRPRT